MTHIMLIQYNNYYNRVKKREESATAYYNVHYAATNNAPYIEGSTRREQEADVNFWENDGIDTAHVFNCTEEEIKEADYAVVYDSDDGAVLSRWFIIEEVRTVHGQYNVTLHRDVIVDNWSAVMNAPSMIQRARIDNKANPLIFQNEGNTYNRIKRKETLLPDRLESRWAVGYITRPETPSTITVSVDPDVTPKVLTATEFNQLASYVSVPHIVEYTYYVGAGYVNMAGQSGPLYPIADLYFSGTRGPEKRTYTPLAQVNSTAFVWNGPNAPSADEMNRLLLSYYYRIGFVDNAAAIKGAFNNVINESDYNDLVALSGQFVSYTDAETNITRTYKVTVTLGQNVDVYSQSQNVDLINDFKAFINEARQNGVGLGEIPGGFNAVRLMAIGQRILVTLEEIHQQGVSVIFDWNHKDLKDAPWAMFAIPLDSIRATGIIDNATYNIWTEPEASALAVRGIISQMGAHVKDVQIVPWCPIPEAIEYHDAEVGNTYEGWQINATLLREEGGVAESEVGTRVISIMTARGTADQRFSSFCYFARVSSGQAVLTGPNLDVVGAETTAEDMKVANETHMARIVSPNHNGSFEFVPVTNMGVRANEWIGRWTYKPFAPYIQVTVQWRTDGLYGGDYRDTRGLICQGDFSMSQDNAAWTDYMLRNKNYQGVFDRQIENLQFTQRQERIQAAFGIASGTTVGAASGAISTIKATKNPGLVAAGAAVGVGLSLAGGIVDYNMLESKQREAQSYQQDMFRMSNENIMASPTTINKVGAEDYAFRPFPVVEEYTATEEEENALRVQIDKTGMRVGVPGKIGDYTVPGAVRYIQANIIQLPELSGDYHLATEIAAEAARGMFIKA